MDTLLRYPQIDWKKLFQLYYQVSISDSFLICADKKLSKNFEQQTGLSVKKYAIRISFEPENNIDHKIGIESSVKANLYFKQGFFPITIKWKSKSGNIFKLSDVINCDDLDFMFENLDIEKCISYAKPKWSLFREIDRDATISIFLRDCGIVVSHSFLSCADKQLTEIFEAKTGIKSNRDIILYPRSGDDFYIEEGPVSKMVVTLYVNPNSNKSVICWKSKTSSRIFKTTDQDIDCSDIDFWFEDFDAALYYHQFYPKINSPFDISDLHFDLIVHRLNINYSVKLVLKKELRISPEDLIKSIDSFIKEYNHMSEKNNRRNGLVHNWAHDIIQSDILLYEFDSGTSGINFFKKFIYYLSDLNSFSTVEVF